MENNSNLRDKRKENGQGSQGQTYERETKVDPESVESDEYADEFNEYDARDRSYVLNAVEVIPRRETKHEPKIPSPKNSGPTVAQFKDHFTLSVPSSVVRYRNSRGAARVIEGHDQQWVLEEAFNKESEETEITIRRIQDSTEGLRLLRLAYTIAAAFWAGFLFVFGMQLLLFLFLDLAIQLGVTGQQQEAKAYLAIGAILGILPLIHGLASSMVLAGAFIVDTNRGHQLVRNFTFSRYSSVTVEWVFFAFFLGFPVLVMCGTLLSGTDDWWTITGVFWVSCIALFYVIFTINVIFYEVRACMEVVRNQYKDDDDSFFAVVKRSIILRQLATYGGSMNRTYVSRGHIEDSEYTDKSSADDLVEGTLHERKNLRARIGMLFAECGWFEHMEIKQRFFTVEDARDVRPFITSHTWSLEKLFCRPRNSRYIAIIRGSGAVTRSQMKSSMLCSLIGSFLIFLIILSVMVYLEAGATTTGFILAIAVLLFIPNLKSTFRLYKVGKDIIGARTKSKNEGSGQHRRHTVTNVEDVTFSARARPDFINPETDSEGLYLVNEAYRVTRPSHKCAWALFWLEVALLFAWPTASLFGIGNWPLGILYFLIVGISGLRYYVNAAVVMEEVGHLNFFNGKTEREIWKNQSRLDDIVGNITRGRSRGAWVLLISIVAFAYLALFVGALGSDQESQQTEDPSYTYLSDFQYSPVENSLRYPTCQMTSNLQESPLTSMADYIFLARVAYRGNITQRELDSWFGEGVAIDQADLVSKYRTENNVDSKVSFKLITYPKLNSSESNASDFAFLAIRGTTNQWEALTDAQLWSPALMMQFLRELLPFGSIWSPVMPWFIQALTAIESNSIEDISFYKDTVRFVEFLKKGDYAGVTVTGHSLGGGLSIMTGAIAHVPAVALSGPNTMLTRRSLEPPVSREELDRYSFNIIPERDIVPMIDDPAQNHQTIRCNADYTDVIGCHDTTRALCEVISTCGTEGRPALCECVTQFGFPEPQPIDPDSNITFAEACNITASN
ncbi:hypothetical protein ACA910_019683 [Epithemia clementina (nom. ined.)]